MKKLIVIIFVLFSHRLMQAQAIKDANVYPTNLEENMWFDSYDAGSKTIKGINFMVLCDGDNSKDRTPAFTVKLYLYQQGKDPIFIKTYHLDGISHMGSQEFKNVSVAFADADVAPGAYRLGLFVDADDDLKEDNNDNAILFKGTINVE